MSKLRYKIQAEKVYELEEETGMDMYDVIKIMEVRGMFNSCYYVQRFLDIISTDWGKRETAKRKRKKKK